MTTLGKIVFGLLVLLMGFVMFMAVYQITNCEYGHTGESYYHTPTYVMSGNIMIPVGGGYYGDFVCDEWK